MLSAVAGPRIRVKLRELLEREGVTAYRLHKEIKGRVGRSTLYRILTDPETPVTTDTIAVILVGLRRITGKEYELRDLLEIAE